MKRDIRDRINTIDLMTRGLIPKDDKKLFRDIKGIASQLVQLQRTEYWQMIEGLVETEINKVVDGMNNTQDKVFIAGVIYGLRAFLRTADGFIQRAKSIKEYRKGLSSGTYGS